MSSIERKSILLIDMDGVICDYNKTMVRKLNKKFCLNLTPNDFDKWKRTETNNKMHIDMKHSDGFYLDMEPVESAIDTIKRRWDKYDIFFTSSPSSGSKTCHSDKHLWLVKHFGTKIAKRLILTKDKTIVYGDTLIDDRLQPGLRSNIRSWKHVLFRTNENKHMSSGQHRIAAVMDSWTNCETIINSVIKSNGV